LVHSDVCGPINVKSLGGVAYFVTFIDDASKKVWDFPIKSKDQVLDTFQKFHMVVERETNKLLRCIRTDNGGEYCSKAFEEYCSKHGIKHVKIVPHTPQQNGTTERMNGTIMEKVRSMLSNSGLPKYFWVEVVRTTCYLINHSPTTSLDGGIPEKVWTGKDLCYTHLKIFWL
jgi:transposase InsO family protein